MTKITENTEIEKGRKFIDELGNIREAIRKTYDDNGVSYLVWKGHGRCAYNLRYCKLHWL